MIINIIRDPSLFESLVPYNRIINEFGPNYLYNKPGQDYDFKNKVISGWFNPVNVRNLGLSRTYPNMDPVQYRPEYSLIIHCSNYLSLFLMNCLYQDRKDVLFEDVGAGLGWLYVYLKALGFHNFHTIENFSQLSEESCREFSDYAQLGVVFNDMALKPVVSNNVGAPVYPVRDALDELELFVCYTNRSFERLLEVEAPKKGYKFLCKDSDDLALAYCREDKWEEFSKKLVPYAE